MGVAICLEHDPGERRLGGCLRARSLDGGGDGRALFGRDVLPHNRVHDDPRDLAARFAAQHFGHEVARGQPGDPRRMLSRRRNGRVHPRETLRQLGPDIGAQPQRLIGVGEIDWRDVAALGGDHAGMPIGRRIATPLGRYSHRGLGWPDRYPAQLEAIAVHHQIDARARPQFKQREVGRATLPSQPQHGRGKAPRAPRLVGLRRSVEPRHEERIMCFERYGDRANRIRNRLARVDRRQDRRRALEVQRVQPARDPERERVGQRRALPTTYPRHHRPTPLALQEPRERIADQRGNGRAVVAAVGDLVLERGPHRLRAGGQRVDRVVARRLQCHCAKPFPCYGAARSCLSR